MFRILFACTANLYRSPLAAALFSKKLRADGQSNEWIVESAGTWTIPGRRIPERLLDVASRLDIDLNSQLTRQLNSSLLAKSDLILVMEKGQREALRVEFPSFQMKIHLLSELADQWEYDIADPVNSDLDMIEFVVEISRLVDRAYPNICKLAQTCGAF